MSKKSIICFGEVLWDCLPRGLFLGGAPFNVAYHLHRLGRQPLMVSSVTNDFLGEETLERMENAGLDTGYVKVRDDLRTGAVKVRIDEAGNASYDILHPAAWDRIELDSDDLRELRYAAALVHGTLAMRDTPNRRTLDDLLHGFEGLKVCDVNLRPSFDDREYALDLMRRADVVKLNDEELEELTGESVGMDSLTAPLEALHSLTGNRRVCVTFGRRGAVFADGDHRVRAPSPDVAVKDTVGAGDAFTAALVDQLLKGADASSDPGFLAWPCALGAFVASCDGAQPDYDPDAVAEDLRGG